MPTTGAPLGVFPLGYGEATAAPEPPDPSASTLSRYINPGSKSYEVDPTTGHLAQMPGTRQRVLIALSSVAGASTVLRELGVRFGGKIDSSIERRMQGEVRFALRHLIAERAIRIERIDVAKRSTGRVRVTVTYTDLLTGQRGQQVTTQS